MKTEITEAAQQLAAIPAADVRPPCDGPCRMLLIKATDAIRVWRCAHCLRFIDAPVSPAHELLRPKRPREPLPDQVTLYDLLGE